MHRRDEKRIEVGKSEEREQLRDLDVDGRIILNYVFKEILCANVYWIHLAQDTDQEWSLLEAIINLWVP
jgi:hypothetical protein